MSKVKIQGNASGTGVVTLTAPNTNTDRTITLPDGDISLGVGIDDNATSTAITIDASENVGIGSSIEAHYSAMHSIQHGFGGNISAWKSNNAVYYLSNAYYGGTWKAINTGTACKYEQRPDGGHTFEVSPSVTADADITWTTAMTIANAGDVTVGTGNLVIGTSGKGIDFSADGNAPGMTSEVLDDYEEGTWTPGSTASAYTSATGTYTKIGQLVHLTFQITTGPAMGGNYFQITGIPFASSAIYVNSGGVSMTDVGSVNYTLMVNGSNVLLRNLANTDYIRYNTYSSKTINGGVTYQVA